MKKIILALILAFFATCSPVSARTSDQTMYARQVQAGMASLKNGDYASAKSSFQEALRYVDTDARAHLGLGVAFFYLGDDSSAEPELLKASRIDPNDAKAFQFLGELYYRTDDLESAASAWEKAVELKPGNQAFRARFERIQKEMQTEKNFNRSVTTHFLIKYEGGEKLQAGGIVLRILEDAYAEVGRSLDYYPEGEIQVILYSTKQYREVTDAPGWSIGLYDGKIRLPIGGIDRETPGLRGVLFHEYTHVVVRSIARRCPAWLNEGLAQYFEGRKIGARQKKTLKRIAESESVPRLSSLEASFARLDRENAEQAYLLSLSSVGYLIDKFGVYEIRLMLDELGRGSDSTKAMISALSVPFDDFEREWQSSLE